MTDPRHFRYDDRSDADDGLSFILVQADAEADTERREGLPFTWQVMAGAMGEICASYAAVAHAAEVLAEQMLILAEAVRDAD